MEVDWNIISRDREILRDLAKRQVEIANEPVMAEKRRLWQKHNSLQGERPMVLLESIGVVNEFLSEGDLVCQEEWARGLEKQFRMRVYHYENVGDDTVVDDYLRCNWQVDLGSYGVDMGREHGTDSQGRTLGFHWEPAIKDLDRDFPKLHKRTCSVDREATFAWQAHLEEVFAGVMPVTIRGNFWWTMGMTMEAIFLIGLENLMLFMYDNPDGIHRLMKFLRDDHLQVAEWLEKAGLLTLNNDNDYVGSGTYGFTTELPQPDWQTGDPVRLSDLWVLLESQETVGISPAMFSEFILPHQIDIANRFGLTYYGCCEPVHNRWQVLKQIPRLRSVSVSPWCDENFMADALGRDYVYSRKPAPSLISTANFDEDIIRQDLENTLKVSKDCNVELIMKDVHTLNGEPERMGRWVKMAWKTIGV